MNLNVQDAYNQWAEQYDTNRNRTRDLEAVALREMLNGLPFSSCLEIGCGTGKNTAWLMTQAAQITAVDLSEEMLAKAKSKIQSDRVNFIQADILEPWYFAPEVVDLITFSLVLEHIEHLGPVLEKASACLKPGGYIYIGELHPFKQYGGTKARFETENGTQIVPCFNHHLSDFFGAATAVGLRVVEIREYFDDHDRTGLPRILAMLLRKG